MKLRLLSCAVAIWASAGCTTEKEFVAEDPTWGQQLDLDQDDAWKSSENLFGEGADPSKLVMRGVRLDLALRADADPDVRCSCLDVAVGPPTDPRFQWTGEVPTITDDQLVVALRPSTGPGCPVGGAAAPKRLSIRAVDVWEPHIIVVIEELGFERPLAMGAVIRKPQSRGSVLLRPRDRQQVFAKSLTAPQAGMAGELQGMCRAYVRQPEEATGVRRSERQ